MVSRGGRQVEPVEPGVGVPGVVAGRGAEDGDEGDDDVGDHIVVCPGVRV